MEKTIQSGSIRINRWAKGGHVRAYINGPDARFRGCYIDLETGELESNSKWSGIWGWVKGQLEGAGLSVAGIVSRMTDQPEPEEMVEAPEIDDIVEVAGDVIRETAKAVLYRATNGKEAWMPKYHIDWSNDGHILTVGWLAREKGLLPQAKRHIDPSLDDLFNGNLFK